MARIIRSTSLSTQRNRLKKGIALSIRELSKRTDEDSEIYDLIAFIILSLDEIIGTVEEAALAWEKRDYWVKADRFRREWQWTEEASNTLKKAFLSKNWGEIAMICGLMGQNLADVKISPKHRMGKPWLGALERLKANSN